MSAKPPPGNFPEDDPELDALLRQTRAGLRAKEVDRVTARVVLRLTRRRQMRRFALNGVAAAALLVTLGLLWYGPDTPVQELVETGPPQELPVLERRGPPPTTVEHPGKSVSPSAGEFVASTRPSTVNEPNPAVRGPDAKPARLLTRSPPPAARQGGARLPVEPRQADAAELAQPKPSSSVPELRAVNWSDLEARLAAEGPSVDLIEAAVEVGGSRAIPWFGRWYSFLDARGEATVAALGRLREPEALELLLAAHRLGSSLPQRSAKTYRKQVRTALLARSDETLARLEKQARGQERNQEAISALVDLFPDLAAAVLERLLATGPAKARPWIFQGLVRLETPEARAVLQSAVRHPTLRRQAQQALRSFRGAGLAAKGTRRTAPQPLLPRGSQSRNLVPTTRPSNHKRMQPSLEVSDDHTANLDQLPRRRALWL